MTVEEIIQIIDKMIETESKSGWQHIVSVLKKLKEIIKQP